MVLHLALCKRIDGLLFHLINGRELGAAADLVRLFYSIETDVLPVETDEFKLVEVLNSIFLSCIRHVFLMYCNDI